MYLNNPITCQHSSTRLFDLYSLDTIHIQLVGGRVSHEFYCQSWCYVWILSPCQEHTQTKHTHMLILHSRRLDELKKNWEQTRAMVGSKWAWLERRISELNKQICRLDYKIQRRPNRKTSLFTTSNATPTSYVALSNGGSLLDHLHLSGSLTGVDKGARKPGNGITNTIPSSQYLPQLFLPGGVSTTRLQVCINGCHVYFTYFSLCTKCQWFLCFVR